MQNNEKGKGASRLETITNVPALPWQGFRELLSKLGLPAWDFPALLSPQLHPAFVSHWVLWEHLGSCPGAGRARLLVAGALQDPGAEPPACLAQTPWGGYGVMMGGQGLVFPVKTAVETADPRRWCRRALRAAAPLPVLLSVMADPSVLTGKKNKTNTCFDSSHVPSALHSPTWRFTRLHGSVISSLTPVLGGMDWSPLLSGRAVCRTLLGVNGGQWAAASALSASS